MNKVDFLIIGQGLAGTVLSYHLLKKKKVLVINNDLISSSSKVAAGIYNPVTGKRLVKTWNAEAIFSYLEPFYSTLEQELNCHFLHPLDIYRPFNSIEEQNECMGKTATGSLGQYILKIDTTSKNNIIKDPYGGITFKNSGYVDIPVLLNNYKNYLISKNAYQEEIFQEDNLIVNENFVQYNNIIADKVIYCDGPVSRFGKYFKWLPFKVVKGELLLIKGNFVLEQIINKGIYLVPMGANLYKVGATYNWTDHGLDLTIEGKWELNEKLQSLLNHPFEIVGHFSGIRPATQDRRPFMGLHPLYKTLAIFNGLGSKGVSLVPYLARQFSEFLLDGKELEKDVNIDRYNSLYFN
ncbi:MAG: FAD-binding oxidoreductase [Bacteroidota bacterium]|nr:FAD-binding oxidoreductase [Bacteroidota bacterium]